MEGHVVELRLSHNNNLQSIDSGAIPTKTLNTFILLGSKKIQGIPFAAISKCANLRELTLQLQSPMINEDKQLVELKLESLRKLKSLSLFGSQFAKFLPDIKKHAPFLEQLTLNSMHLDETSLPDDYFATFPFLTSLSLSSNEFTGIPVAVKYAKHLEILSFENNLIGASDAFKKGLNDDSGRRRAAPGSNSSYISSDSFSNIPHRVMSLNLRHNEMKYLPCEAFRRRSLKYLQLNTGILCLHCKKEKMVVDRLKSSCDKLKSSNSTIPDRPKPINHNRPVVNTPPKRILKPSQNIQQPIRTNHQSAKKKPVLPPVRPPHPTPVPANGEPKDQRVLQPLHPSINHNTKTTHFVRLVKSNTVINKHNTAQVERQGPRAKVKSMVKPATGPKETLVQAAPVATTNPIIMDIQHPTIQPVMQHLYTTSAPPNRDQRIKYKINKDRLDTASTTPKPITHLYRAIVQQPGQRQSVNVTKNMQKQQKTMPPNQRPVAIKQVLVPRNTLLNQRILSPVLRVGQTTTNGIQRPALQSGEKLTKTMIKPVFRPESLPKPVFGPQLQLQPLFGQQLTPKPDFRPQPTAKPVFRPQLPPKPLFRAIPAPPVRTVTVAPKTTRKPTTPIFMPIYKMQEKDKDYYFGTAAPVTFQPRPPPRSFYDYEYFYLVPMSSLKTVKKSGNNNMVTDETKKQSDDYFLNAMYNMENRMRTSLSNHIDSENNNIMDSNFGDDSGSGAGRSSAARVQRKPTINYDYYEYVDIPG